MMNNKKFLVLYTAHFINKFSLDQYYKLKNELPENYDLYWWLDDSCKDKKLDNINFIEFPHHYISPKPLQNTPWFNPMKYMETYFINNDWFRKYDFYWIVEYDVYFSGNWGIFFNTIDKYDEDLVGSAFTIYKDTTNPISFSNIKFDNFRYKIKSYISIYRISNRAMEYISNYSYINLNNMNDIRNYLYEIYIPTMLYNKEYTLLSLNSEKFIKESGNYIYDYSNMDFVNYYDDCKFIDNAVKTFWWDIIFNNINEMNVPNKLYTRYKP